MASISNVEKSKKGRPTVDSTAVTMRVSDQLIRKIDDWRREQPDMPIRTEAIRRLVEKALDEKF